MPIHFHLLTVLSYLVLAAAAIVAVPVTDVSPTYLAGGLVLIAGAVLHMAVAGALRRRDLNRDLQGLRASHFDLVRELGLALDETSRLQEELGKTPAPTHDVERVVDEVRVLQRLVEQLSAKNPGAPATTDTALPIVSADPGAPISDRPPMLPVAEGLDEQQVLVVVKEGLKANQVDLFLQPIVSLPQRKRRFYECFSRIRVGGEAMVVPEQYLAIAEREGLINAIDNLLLFRCVQLVRKSQLQKYGVDFICNISPYNLDDRAFFREFLEFMARNSELAPNLIFEFAQQDVSEFDPEVTRQLDRLAVYGFRYSMDRVTDLNVDYDWLRLHSFVLAKIGADIMLERIHEGSEEEIRTLKRALDRNNIDLVVDKIESEQDLLELLDFGIDFGQGYLFGEPRLSRPV